MGDETLTTADIAGYVHPFWQGQHAYEAGKSEYDNPYSNDQWEHTAWQHGWDEANEQAD